MIEKPYRALTPDHMTISFRCHSRTARKWQARRLVTTLLACHERVCETVRDVATVWAESSHWEGGESRFRALNRKYLKDPSPCRMPAGLPTSKEPLVRCLREERRTDSFVRAVSSLRSESNLRLTDADVALQPLNKLHIWDVSEPSRWVWKKRKEASDIEHDFRSAFIEGTSRVFRTHSCLFPPSHTRLSNHLSVTEVKVGPALRERVDSLKELIEEKYGDFVEMQGCAVYEKQILRRTVGRLEEDGGQRADRAEGEGGQRADRAEGEGGQRVDRAEGDGGQRPDGAEGEGGQRVDKAEGERGQRVDKVEREGAEGGGGDSEVGKGVRESEGEVYDFSSIGSEERESDDDYDYLDDDFSNYFYSSPASVSSGFESESEAEGQEEGREEMSVVT
uniref:Uncharacterized protein n=1 Tax=Chromera velia CCMP2878 TaxID=1169474 RepID=A0A0G4HC71_9ALVE|eukprot:Cvel_26005.t1-p1 / transcript=Cvel_26005.t1 / gene=Cvel_26005 / organism=Chromera_velia_CCMP2878 / gene_product=hypothetical protein / transcript_product=hypothetical protein / location=Cvel_scaffold3026:9306-10527(+) / protein_length=392 / sequence_SO=supercontig / SO=protein_coding / is_pseudo=false